MRVRYRIDGRLHKALDVPQHLLDAVTSRIKTMGAMDVDQRHMPQDGEVHVMLEGRKIDLRVEHLPRRPRREDGDPRARRPGRLLEARRLGIRRGRADRLPDEHPRPERHHPGDGADGKRKIHHALRRPRRAGDDGKQRLHR